MIEQKAWKQFLRGAGYAFLAVVVLELGAMLVILLFKMLVATLTMEMQ